MILLSLLLAGCTSQIDQNIDNALMDCQHFFNQFSYSTNSKEQLEVKLHAMDKKNIKISKYDENGNLVESVVEVECKEPDIQLDKNKLKDRFNDDLIEKPEPIFPKEETE